MTRWESFLFKVAIVLFLSGCVAGKVEIQEVLYHGTVQYINWNAK